MGEAKAVFLTPVTRKGCICAVKGFEGTENWEKTGVILDFWSDHSERVKRPLMATRIASISVREL